MKTDLTLLPTMLVSVRAALEKILPITMKSMGGHNHFPKRFARSGVAAARRAKRRRKNIQLHR